jgi:2-polyprenyl-3-methyl-5-hydroxy-6-metoxy-1,4-benzoquinol methylase
MADIEFYKNQYENDSYYTMGRKDLEDIDNKWGMRWRHVLKAVGKYMKAGSGKKLLDVGAGNGYFIKLARDEFGFDATGIGISQHEIEFAKKVTGVDILLEDISQHKSDYDIITNFNVIEHVVDPQAFLESMISRLNPGGLLVISTPNTTCMRARLRGLKNWERIDPPHHINLFPKKTLRYLLRKNGMKELKYQTMSTYISFVDTRNIFARRAIFHILKMFNLGADHMIFAEKS